MLLKSGQQLEAECDELLAQVASLSEEIDQLSTELGEARRIATDALVGKAKDRLAIEGKDSQLAELRLQMERNATAAAALSGACLNAEMKLVGAVAAHENSPPRNRVHGSPRGRPAEAVKRPGAALPRRGKHPDAAFTQRLSFGVPFLTAGRRVAACSLEAMCDRLRFQSNIPYCPLTPVRRDARACAPAIKTMTSSKPS